jgi:glutathione S-transferase
MQDADIPDEVTPMNASAPVKVYLKKVCPYSLKLRIFLTEAGIANRVEFVVFTDGDATHQALRSQMQAAGQKPSFPAAEIEPGKLTTDSDALIAHFGNSAGVNPAALPLLRYYSEGVFQKYNEMYRELKQLQGGA